MADKAAFIIGRAYVMIINSNFGQPIKSQIVNMTTPFSGEEKHPETEGDDEEFGVLELPPEILLNIFRFIDVRTLYGIVILTCKHFHEVLTSEGIWKTLFALKWKEQDFVKDLPFISSWGKVYLTFEDIDTFWRKKDDVKNRLKTKKLVGHYGTIDSVYIMPSRQIFVSGSRDRTAMVWKVSDFVESNFETELPAPEVLKGHKGWVWSIACDETKDNEVVTTSWDKTVKVWDLQDIGTCKDTYAYHPAAVLAILCNNSIHTTACYDKKIRRFDVRSGKVILEKCHHKRPVLAIQMTDKYIFSGSEDQTVGIFDIRAGKLFTKLRLDSSVLCMNLASEQGLNYLRVGGKNGSLYVFDVSGDRFSLLNSFELWTDGHKVSSLCNYRGSLIACSEGGSVRAYTPDRQCTFIKKFDTHLGGITSCHANNNLFITGGSDASVVAWKFKSVY